MFVYCSCGLRHWGRYGAAGLLLTDPGRSHVLLQRRSSAVHHGGTWAFVGGAIERGESATDAAIREAVEEEGLDPSRISPVQTLPGLTHPEWAYTYVVAEGDSTDPQLLGRSWDWESDGVEWVRLAEVSALPLHPVLGADWPWLAEALTA